MSRYPAAISTPRGAAVFPEREEKQREKKGSGGEAKIAGLLPAAVRFRALLFSFALSIRGICSNMAAEIAWDHFIR